MHAQAGPIAHRWLVYAAGAARPAAAYIGRLPGPHRASAPPPQVGHSKSSAAPSSSESSSSQSLSSVGLKSFCTSYSNSGSSMDTRFFRNCTSMAALSELSSRSDSLLASTSASAIESTLMPNDSPLAGSTGLAATTGVRRAVSLPFRLSGCSFASLGAGAGGGCAGAPSNDATSFTTSRRIWSELTDRRSSLRGKLRMIFCVSLSTSVSCCTSCTLTERSRFSFAGVSYSSMMVGGSYFIA
mmetsp:Transcript_9901/g.25252  ORF Transcript_9901/g.25252 Transcript_9901/m.25252 type:complete len:242 (-) Transcript_9901:99-824(-)